MELWRWAWCWLSDWAVNSTHHDSPSARWFEPRLACQWCVAPALQLRLRPSCRFVRLMYYNVCLYGSTLAQPSFAFHFSRNGLQKHVEQAWAGLHCYNLKRFCRASCESNANSACKNPCGAAWLLHCNGGGGVVLPRKKSHSDLQVLSSLRVCDFLGTQLQGLSNAAPRCDVQHGHQA